MDPSLVEEKILHHFEKRGLVETFHWRFSKYLVQKSRWSGKDVEKRCSLGSDYHRKAMQEDSDRAPIGQKWSNCTGQCSDPVTSVN